MPMKLTEQVQTALAMVQAEPEKFDDYKARLESTEGIQVDDVVHRLVSTNRLKLLLKAQPRREGQEKELPVLWVTGVKS